ncbi:hypothetical protein RB653_001613 [Dictyostelium firmibasis]|uniref:Isochorismatase-like domain-containing protein n=1 Tax=Dictyostelium firmibasis TaxID=79012 RepID=A0AAN7U5C5_9MYCE
MIGDIFSESTALFVCDAQKYYTDKIESIDIIISNTKCLIDSCKQLGIDVFMTKHKPDQYGEIIEELDPSNQIVYTKTLYSMFTPELKDHVDELYDNGKYRKVHSIILVGLETHVCIVQTALDLLKDGYQVHVIIDATTSINNLEYYASLKRLKQSGVFLTTTEAILFQLIKDDNHPSSTKIIELITNRSKSLPHLQKIFDLK